MDRWENKVAIVTGASAGIGEAIAIELTAAGVKVVGLSRRKDRLDSLTKKLENSKGKFYGIVCDLSVEEEILEVFSWISTHLGPIHILINNAAAQCNTNLIEGDTKMWKQTLDTNVLGLCIATREAIKDMKVNDIDGHIIHINSLNGHRVVYFPRINVYAATKFAVTALTETLRIELNSIKSKIKVTSISPGMVKTQMADESGLFDKIISLVGDTDPPFIEPKDVADAVVYVLSTPPHVQVHELMIRPVGEPL